MIMRQESCSLVMQLRKTNDFDGFTLPEQVDDLIVLILCKWVFEQAWTNGVCPCLLMVHNGMKWLYYPRVGGGLKGV